MRQYINYTKREIIEVSESLEKYHEYFFLDPIKYPSAMLEQIVKDYKLKWDVKNDDITYFTGDKLIYFGKYADKIDKVIFNVSNRDGENEHVSLVIKELYYKAKGADELSKMMFDYFDSFSFDYELLKDYNQRSNVIKKASVLSKSL